MTVSEILNLYQNSPKTGQVIDVLKNDDIERLHLKGLVGSQRSFLAAAVYQAMRGTHIFILPDKESAAYFHNDLESLFVERDMEYSKRRVLIFPTSYKRPYEIETTDRKSVV